MLAERRAERLLNGRPTHAEFYFDLGCPFSYLAAERIERMLGHVEWVPSVPLAPEREERGGLAAFRAHAETCAVALRLPLVWPDRLAEPPCGALRAAAYAAEQGAGARFALAASRLAFCGGFDLEDPEILAEAAAAAGVPLQGCLAAAHDQGRDEALRATARRLRANGIRRLPAIRIGRRWFEGEHALAEAGALLRARARARTCAMRELRAAPAPLAPAS